MKMTDDMYMESALRADGIASRMIENYGMHESLHKRFRKDIYKTVNSLVKADKVRKANIDEVNMTIMTIFFIPYYMDQVELLRRADFQDKVTGLLKMTIRSVVETAFDEE